MQQDPAVRVVQEVRGEYAVSTARVYIRPARIMWDFRLGCCRLYLCPTRYLAEHARPVPGPVWPFLRIEVEHTGDN